ncbi:MAG: hypothetical protein MZV63_47030 [Marinilabiliales bacterium]|nr:hypothetical protein [Marinilabiliales bacterium]
MTGFAAGLMIFNNLAWFFGYLGGLPQLNARFMGMKDDRNVRSGRNIAVAWTIIAYAGVVVIGLGAAGPLRTERRRRLRNDPPLPAQRHVPRLAGRPSAGRRRRGHDLDGRKHAPGRGHVDQRGRL